jgi:FMN phosphatase YigB (HAD superfamily)
VKAIIFDLDDTLFDCDGQLVRPAHEDAVDAMMAAGLEGDREEVLVRRLAIFAANPRDDVNRLLAESYGCADAAVIEAGHRAYFQREVGEIVPFDGARRMLERLRGMCRLFLVTSGDIPTQMRKVERLDLEGSFDGIVYVDPGRGETKEEAFRGILDGERLDPGECVAVGNRVDSEIAAGKRLGMRTIWLRHGEFAHLEPEESEEVPDVTVDDFRELADRLLALIL